MSRIKQKIDEIEDRAMSGIKSSVDTMLQALKEIDDEQLKPRT